MAKKKHEKLFIYQSPPNPFHPPGSFPGTEMFVMTDNEVKGARPYNVCLVDRALAER